MDESEARIWPTESTVPEQLETIYIPDSEFAHYIRARRDKAELVVVEGFYEWVVTDTDGVRRYVRPGTETPEEIDPQ